MIRKQMAAGLALMMLLLTACQDEPVKSRFTDTPTSGTINISVDESFRPVIEEQIRVYEASYPGTHINATFKTEADCLKDFFRDSLNRMVIVTRGLTAKEERFMIDSLGYNPGWNEIASDAIAVVINSKSNDSLFTMGRLQQQLTGKINRNQTIVFDGLNATSTVRYISDSILRGEQFDTSVVKATKNSQEVIDYVAQHEDAIGLVGISWIGNPEDSAQVNLLKKVKIAFLQCDACQGKPYVKPMQESILTRRYPLVRGLYYITKENFSGLGTGFVSFLKYERGQLIFKRAYLGPVMGFGVRNVKINESLPKK
ncbi:MAG TPA: substrate-binding domain-containing protein [Ferruginibacter sp.]|nr:substrate-binding domain-containing protein [Ferruginibacter sp.]